VHAELGPLAARLLLLLNGSATNAVAARLGGKSTSLADIQLLAVLVRFDSTCSGLFKCFRCGVASYLALAAYAWFMAAEAGASSWRLTFRKSPTTTGQTSRRQAPAAIKPTYFRDHVTPYECLPLPHSPTPRPPIRRIARPPKPQLSSRLTPTQRTHVHFCPRHWLMCRLDLY
jgi:hypothetical protein